MLAAIQKLSSLFLSIAILLIGHGLQQTLIPLQGQALGWSSSAIGLTGAAYFLGFILGCFYVPGLIRRVGHIRVFAFCVGLVIVAVLSIARWPMLWVWLLFRGLTGAALAGLYMIFESWLNERSANNSRGSVLSFYGLVSIAALSVGQMLLFDADLLTGASLVAIMLALAIAPVALSANPQPAVPAEVHPDFRFTHRASQVALVCAATAGVVMGLVWSNGAVYVSDLTGHPSAGARFIVCALLGGLFAQMPIGRLSDLMDRRWILLVLALFGVAGNLYWLYAGAADLLLLYALGGLLGATAMPMYSLALAHANDNAQGRFLQIAGAMLVANGLGSAAGPLLFAGALALGLPNSLFGIISGAFGITALWTGYRLLVHGVARAHFEPFQAVPRTTQSAAALDPRADPSSDSKPDGRVSG